MPSFEPTAIDLFCGAGGLSIGLENSGFRPLFGADNWDVAVKTYRLNFGHPAMLIDLGKATSEELWRELGVQPQTVHLVVGGPPCQGFSIQRIGPELDVRNNLILEFARLVTEFRPRLFVMENVPGLLGKRGCKLARVFEESLSSAGYEMEVIAVNAAAYGVPQTRRRVFYYGWPRGQEPFRFPQEEFYVDRPVTVWEAIGDLPSPPRDFTPLAGDPLHRRTRLSPLNERRIRLIPPGGGMEHLPRELRAACHREGADRIGHRYVYGRLAPDKPAATITARFDSFTRGKFGHPVEPRNITLREGARLQTFPDTFRFVGTQEERAALIGNAIPSLLAGVIGTAAHSYLTASPNPDVETRRPPGGGAARQLALFKRPG